MNIQETDVNMVIYDKMLESCIKLRNWIREKNNNSNTISQEEADFVNDFEAYVNELVSAMKRKEQNNL